MKSLIIVDYLCFFQFHFFPQQTEVPLIPMKDFFKYQKERLSDFSGSHDAASFMQPVNSRMNVFIQKMSETATQITFATERDIAGYFWKGNNRIIYVSRLKGR